MTLTHRQVGLLTRAHESLPRCVHRRNIFDHPRCFTKDGFVKDNWWVGKNFGFLDIESSGFNAEFSSTHCWVIKRRGVDVYVSDNIRWGRSYRERDAIEKRSMQKLCDAMRGFDIIVTYYGDGRNSRTFDIKFLRTKALQNDLDFPIYREIYQHDLYMDARMLLKLRSYRLDVVAKALKCPYQKTDLDPEIWRQAHLGSAPAKKYVYEHCIVDTKVLEWCFEKLLPHINISKKAL